jgi:hypothetical protein
VGTAGKRVSLKTTLRAVTIDWAGFLQNVRGTKRVTFVKQFIISTYLNLIIIISTNIKRHSLSDPEDLNRIQG